MRNKRRRKQEDGSWKKDVIKPEIRIFDTPEQLFDQTAHLILNLVLNSSFIQHPSSIISPPSSLFAIALAGGSTPRKLYERMAQDDFKKNFPWGNTHFFFGDERWVPHTDERSNYRMARETLLDQVPVPISNIHPVPFDRASPDASAEAYEKSLREFFQRVTVTQTGDSHPFLFDLILLGIGEDGHTASLFPGDSVLDEKAKWVAAAKTNSDDPRITLTLPLINQARCVLFLASGKSKKEILKKLLGPKEQPCLAPAARVNPVNGRLLFHFDCKV